MHKLGIVDHVGVKSGMDIYDISLANQLALSLQVYILSNFKNSNDINTKVTLEVSFNLEEDGKSPFKKMLYFFKGFLKSFWFLKKKGCKWIILHSFSFEHKDLVIILLSKILGFKLLLIVHDVSGFANKDSNLLKKIILKKLAYKVLVHNEFSKQHLLSDYSISSKIVTIRHGGYINFINASINKKKALSLLNLNHSFKYILFFGQIKEVKGLDLLIRAFGEVSNNKVKLIIAGKPWKDDFSKYENLIHEYGLSEKVILFKRFIPDNEKDLLFTVSHLVVIPYKKIFQSGVLLTALSYPSLVLCSDLEPNKEIIQNNYNGFLFKSESISSLSSMLNSILNEDSQKIVSIKKNALKTVKTEYSWDYASKKILNIFE